MLCRASKKYFSDTPFKLNTRTAELEKLKITTYQVVSYFNLYSKPGNLQVS